MNNLTIKIKATTEYIYLPPEINVSFEGSIYAFLEILKCVFYCMDTYFISEFKNNTVYATFLVGNDIDIKNIHSKLNNQLHNLSLFNIKKEKYETKI